MKKILQVIQDKDKINFKIDYELQEDKVVILYEENQNQNVLIIDFSSFQFFEYPLINIQAKKVICDKNLTNLLIFEENSINSKKFTTIYQVNLEKAITPIHKSEIELIGITKVYWFNSNLCFILMKNNLVMYDLAKNTITNQKQLEINTIFDIQVDPQFKYFICCHLDSHRNLQCTLLAKDNFENKLKLENSVYDFIDREQGIKLFVMSKNQNEITFYFVKFEDETFIKEGEQKHNICKNDGQLTDLQNIVSIKYRKKQNDILLLDSLSQLFVLACDKEFKLKFKQKYNNVLKYGFTVPNYDLILMNKTLELFVDTSQMVFNKKTIPISPQSLSFETQTKKKQLHGISCQNYNSNNQKQILKEACFDEFKRFESKFNKFIKTDQQFDQFPQAEFRIISFSEKENAHDITKLVPLMKDYQETDTVKKYLQLFELILKSDQPVICEGDAASGKTSIIQYLAHLKQQPLLTMNLNSNTQIDDFTGKIEIQPGFKFTFKLGPFTQAVKNGYWILLDEANLAPDSILRVIEDVLELGYFTLYGNNVNSHRDTVDGVLTIRKHSNFRLFLTQNPAVNERFAASRNKFSKSFLSQFILLQFPTMTLDSIRQIVSKQILGRINQLSLDQRSALCDLIMKIYSLIKQHGQDDGLFTLRDVLQLLELLALENNHKNVIGLDILPMKFCIEQVLTQFCSETILHQVKEEISKFERFGYSNQTFEDQYSSYTTRITNWSLKQQSMYLSCYNFLLKFLTLCYKTKRAALIVSQQYCGKLSSVLFWLKLQDIQYFEIVELSANTTYEDLFGKYQSKNSGFEFIEGPVVKCFVKGGVLILKNLEAPESSLTECLNGILERHCRTLIANNKEHQRNENFFVIGISSDENELQKKFTPALKSRFLQFNMNYEVTIFDLKNVLIQHAKMNLNEKVIQKIFDQIQSLNKNADQLVSFSQLIRIIRPIKEFSNFYMKCFTKTLEESIKKIEDNIDFFILLSLSLEQKTLSLTKFNQIPIKFKEISEAEQTQKFVFTQSRTLISDIIATSIACKQSLILQGSAGVGKTKIISIIQQQCNYFSNTQFYYINMNQNTELNDLMGSYVSSQEVKNTFEFKKGPLLLGMEQGGIVLCDEVNLVDRSIMNFLASVIKYPKEFFDPVSNEFIKVNEKFRLFFAQNPPLYEGRNEITDSLASKSVVVIVPNYTFEEVTAITSTNDVKINDGMKIFLSEIIKYPPDGDECLLNKNGVQFTLRQFLKFKKRLIKINFQNEQKDLKELVELHQEILFPFSNKILLSSNIIKKDNMWIFTIQNQKKSKSVSCQFSVKKNLELESQQQETIVQTLSEEAKLVLCKIAFAYYCQENILLQGPTSYKTFLLKLFSEMISFTSKIAFDIIYITNVTELNQLIGAVESHNESSYKNYCINILKRIEGEQINEQQIIETITKLQSRPHLKQNESFFKDLQANMKNQFPFVERGITLNARFGGIVYLKNINLADQSVIEGLNSLLELEPQFYVNGKKIEKLNSELFVAASMNESSGGKLSDALQSRLTIIQIFDKNLLDDSNQLKNTLKEYLNKMTNPQDSKEATQFIEQVLLEVKNQNRTNYDNINLRTFYLWANTLKCTFKEIELPNIQNLYLGSQFLILDPIKNDINLSKQKNIIEKFGNAQRQIDNIIQSKFNNNNRLILNRNTQQIIERILFSLQVQSITCLIGPPGVGKSAIAKEIAKVLKKKFCRVCCSDNLSVEDLFGSYAPQCSSNQEQCFIFKEGYLAKALRDKSVILFDEINLASPEVLSTLQQLFNKDEQFLTVKDFVIDKTGNLFLCCMNPPDYQGRNELPFCISNLMTKYYIQQFSIDETIDIFEKSYANQIQNVVKQGIDFNIIIKLHRELANSQKDQSQLQYDFNIRFLQNLLSLFNENFFRWRGTLSKEYQQEIVVICLEIIYKEHFTDITKQDQILKLILQKYQIDPVYWQQRQLYLVTFYTHLQLNRDVNKIFNPYLTLEKINRFSPQQPQNNFVITHQNSQIFEKLFITIQSKRIILCQGDVASGKSTTILKFAQLLNQRAIFLPIYSELETDDLLGNFSMINEIDENHKEWLSSFVNQKYEKAQSVMRYINGILKICMEYGYWLIMDNVNLAKAEILERLNSLGEDEPELYINEFGDEKGRIVPHENFRLICIQNPNKRTEDQNLQPLSHAFYNRCLKINFNLDLKNNFSDFIEMLSRKNDTQRFYSENNVYFAQKLLSQLCFIREKDKEEKNFRVIKRTFRMQEENNFQSSAEIISINYGDAYNKWKNDKAFPLIDLNNIINYDSVLNSLITNTLNLENLKIDFKQIQVDSLKQLLKEQLQKRQFQQYKYFIETICDNFKINNSETQSYNNNNGNFNLKLCGNYTLNSLGFYFSITPLEVEFLIQNQILKKFCMKIELKFQQYQFQATIYFQENQQFQLTFNEASLEQLKVEELIPFLPTELKDIVFGILKKSEMIGNLIMQEDFELNLQFKKLSFTLADFGLELVQFKNIEMNAYISKKKRWFIINCIISIYDVELLKITNFSTTRGQVQVIPSEIMQLLGKIHKSAQFFFEHFNLKQSKNKDDSTLDLIEKNISLSLMAENLFSIGSLFSIQLDQLQIEVSTKNPLNCNCLCTLLICKNPLCQLQCNYDSKTKENLKFAIVLNQKGSHIKDSIFSLFGNLFAENCLISSEKQISIEKILSGSLEIDFEEIKCFYKLQFNWVLQIQGIKLLEFQTMSLEFTKKSQSYNLNIGFEIEVLTMQMETKLELDYNPNKQNKKDFMRMNINKLKQQARLRDLIKSYSSEINKIMQEQQQYDEQMIDLASEKKNQFFEWKKNDFNFQLVMDFQNQEWKILQFLFLSKCQLELSGSLKSLNIKISGQIRIINLNLPQFNLELNIQKNQSLQIELDQSAQFQSFNPLEMGLELLGNKDLSNQFKDTDIFPKMNGIEIFKYDLIKKEFTALFKTKSETKLEFFKILTLKSVKFAINYSKERFDIKLKTDMQISNLNLNLILDFPSFLEEIKGQNSNTLCFKLKATIEKISLNQFVQDFFKFNFPKYTGDLMFERINLTLSIQKQNNKWGYQLQFQLSDGTWTISDNLIKFTSLRGEILYDSEKSWIFFKIFGKIQINNEEIGSLEIDFLKQEGPQKIIPIIPNENFKLENLTKILSDSQNSSPISFPFEINNTKIDIVLKTNEVTLQAVIKFNCYKPQNYIELKDIGLQLELSIDSQKRLSSKCFIKFDASIFDVFKLQGSYTFPHNEAIIQGNTGLNLMKILELMQQYSNFSFPQIQQLYDLNFYLNIEVTVAFDVRNKFTMNKFIIQGSSERIKQAQDIINFESYSFNWDILKQKIEVEGYIIFCQNFRFKWKYCSGDSKLKFTAQKSQQQTFDQISQQVSNNCLDSRTFPFFKDNFEFLNFDVDWLKKQINMKLEIPSLGILEVLIKCYQSQGYLFIELRQGMKFQQFCQWLSILDSIIEIPSGQMMICLQGQNQELSIEDSPNEGRKMITQYQECFNIENLTGSFITTKIQVKLKGSWWKYLLINQQIELNFNLSMQQKKLKTSVFSGQPKDKVQSEFRMEGEWRNNTISNLSLLASYQINNLKMIGSLTFGEWGAEGELSFKYTNAFSIKNLTLSGSLKLRVERTELSIIGQAGVQYKSFKGELVLYFSGFILKGAAIRLENLSFSDILEYFSIQTIIPKQVLRLIPKIEQLTLEIGQLKEEEMNQYFYPICEQSEDCCECINCDQIFADPPPSNPFDKIVFKIITSLKLKRFQFNFNLFFFLNKSATSPNCLINGEFGFKYCDDKTTQLSLDCKLSGTKTNLALYGKIQIFDDEAMLKGSLGLEGFDIKFQIKIGDRSFTAGLTLQIRNLNFGLELKYYLSSDPVIAKKGWEKLISIKHIEIEIKITKKSASGKLILKGSFLYFGPINKELYVEFNYSSIMDQLLEVLNGLINYLRYFLKGNGEYYDSENEIKNIINDKCCEIKQQCDEDFGPGSVECNENVTKQINEKNKAAQSQAKNNPDQSKGNPPPPKKKETKNPPKNIVQEDSSESEEEFFNQNQDTQNQNNSDSNETQKPVDPHLQKFEDLEQKFKKETLSNTKTDNKQNSSSKNQQSNNNSNQNNNNNNNSKQTNQQSSQNLQNQNQNSNQNQTTSTAQNSQDNQKSNPKTTSLPNQQPQVPNKQNSTPSNVQPPPQKPPGTDQNRDPPQQKNVQQAQNYSDQNKNTQSIVIQIPPSTLQGNLQQQQRSQNPQQQIPQKSESQIGQTIQQNRNPIQAQKNEQPCTKQQMQNVQPQKQQAQNQPIIPQQSQNLPYKPFERQTIGADKQVIIPTLRPQAINFSQQQRNQYFQPQSRGGRPVETIRTQFNIIPRNAQNVDQGITINLFNLTYPQRRRVIVEKKKNDSERQTENRIQHANQQKQALQQYNLKSNYSVLNQVMLKLFMDKLQNCQNEMIERLKVRVIIINKKQFSINQKELILLCQLLVSLSFLKMKFEVIFSGSFEPLIMKSTDENLTFYVLDRILHALLFKQNQSFFKADELSTEDLVIIYNFDKEILELSDECAHSLKICGLEQVYFYGQQQIVEVNLDNTKINHPNNIFSLFSYHASKPKKWRNQQLLQKDQQIDIEQIMNNNAAQLRKSKGIANQLKVSKFTKYSLSSKGTIIDIKGIIKFFCSNGTCKDIMKKKDKGGKLFYVFQIMLDLMNLDNEIIVGLILPFLLFLIEACKELKIVCNLIICQDNRFIKQNFQHNWTEAEIRDLLKYVQDPKKYEENNKCRPALDLGVEQLRKFNQYQKYLIFINHSLFNYPKQQIEKLFSQQSIKVVNLDFEEVGIFNFSFQNIRHYQIFDVEDFSKILEQIISHDVQQKDNQKQHLQFEFIQNEEIYSNSLEITQLKGQQMLQKQEYINQYFNYYEGENSQDDEENEEMEEIDGDENAEYQVGLKINTETIFQLMLLDDEILMIMVAQQKIPIELYLKVNFLKELCSNELKGLEQSIQSLQQSDEESDKQE